MFEGPAGFSCLDPSVCLLWVLEGGVLQQPGPHGDSSGSPGRSVEGEGGLLSVWCIFLFRLQVTPDFVSNPEKSELSRLPSVLWPVSVIANYTTWGGGWGAFKKRKCIFTVPEAQIQVPRGPALSEGPRGGACMPLSGHLPVAGTPCL